MRSKLRRRFPLFRGWMNCLVLELKENPEAKDCIEYVADLLNSISNDNILKGCSISWDDANKGFLLVRDDILPKYIFKADIIICKDYYHYSFIIRDRDGNYLGSSQLDNFPEHTSWQDITSHLEEVYESF